MSFVYAEKGDNSLDIHCDTKIELDSFAGASFSLEQIELIRKYGIVKTTLVCPEISISFAGNNIYLASKLFNRLYKKRRFSTKELVDMAYAIHMEGNINDIEFIIASCDEGVLSLICIKEHEIHTDCIFAWIGSHVAHREFQEYRIKNNEGKASDRTNGAFLEIVQGCSDKSVGGFHITVGYNSVENIIGYKRCKTFQNTNRQIIQPGKTVRFLVDAQEGGFSFEQIPVSMDDLILRIDQMEPAILYSKRARMTERDMENSQLFSLMLPMLIREDGNGKWIRL